MIQTIQMIRMMQMIQSIRRGLHGAIGRFESAMDAEANHLRRIRNARPTRQKIGPGPVFVSHAGGGERSGPAPRPFLRLKSKLAIDGLRWNRVSPAVWRRSARPPLIQQCLPGGARRFTRDGGRVPVPPRVPDRPWRISAGETPYFARWASTGYPLQKRSTGSERLSPLSRT